MLYFKFKSTLNTQHWRTRICLYMWWWYGGLKWVGYNWKNLSKYFHFISGALLNETKFRPDRIWWQAHSKVFLSKVSVRSTKFYNLFWCSIRNSNRWNRIFIFINQFVTLNWICCELTLMVYLFLLYKQSKYVHNIIICQYLETEIVNCKNCITYDMIKGLVCP